jgi:hypothetical protein
MVIVFCGSVYQSYFIYFCFGIYGNIQQKSKIFVGEIAETIDFQVEVFFIASIVLPNN